MVALRHRLARLQPRGAASRLTAIAIGLWVASTAWSYTQPTHAVITQIVVTSSILGSGSSPLLAGLQCHGTTACTAQDAAGTLGQAAIDEDNGVRALSHFYDAQNDGAALLATLSLTPAAAAAACAGATGLGLPEMCLVLFSGSANNPASASSQLWSLGGVWQTAVEFQHYPDPTEPPPVACGLTDSAYICDYAVAKTAYLTALTAQTPGARNGAASTLFQNLGHMLHHVEDMAQPQHVRNDLHCDSYVCIFLTSVGVKGLGVPSAYEKYTEAAVLATQGSQFAALARNGPMPLNTLPTPAFKAAGDFWATTDGTARGIAQFTSDNFFSVGTGPTLSGSGSGVTWQAAAKYPLPVPTEEILTIKTPNCTAPQSLAPPGSERYLLGSITDQEEAGPARSGMLQNTTNAPLGAVSLVKTLGLAHQWATTQDCVTYDQAMYLLLPQAIRYGSWFVDFFFRATFTAALDPNGNLTVSNTTSTGETLSGSVTLYANAADGTRTPASSASCQIGLAAGTSNAAQPCPMGSLQATTPAATYLLVFNGSIGNESNQVGFVRVVQQPQDHTIGVTVSGLLAGESVTLQNNGADDLTVSMNGVVSNFATPILNGATYDVTVLKQPPGEQCTVGSNGNGTVAGANVVVAVTCGTQAKKVSAMVTTGENHACALSTAGLLYCWGSNLDGQLGNGTQGQSAVTAPVQVTGLAGVSSVSAGWYFTCATTVTAQAWCWGLSTGQLGYGNNPPPTINPSVPNPVVGTTGSGTLSGVAAISAGGQSTCALIQGGQVVCWGSNAQGQLGVGSQVSTSAVPMPVPGVSGVIAVATGYEHACALTGAGEVFCWGDDTFGELGDGNINSISFKPIPVAGLPAGIISITAGWYSTCVNTNTGAAACWGYDLYGELGVGPPAVEYTTPQPVLGLASGAIALSTFTYHSCAQIGGGAQCWGNEGLGLGNDVPDQSGVPATVVNPSGTGPLTGVSQLSVGDGFTCAVISTGGVDCWGNNNAGQVGNGTTSIPSPAHSTPPTPVVGVGGSGFLQL